MRLGEEREREIFIFHLIAYTWFNFSDCLALLSIYLCMPRPDRQIGHSMKFPATSLNDVKLAEFSIW